MPKIYTNGYQLDDLRTAARAVEQATHGLEIVVDYTGEDEKTEVYGVVPVVEYTIYINGQRRHGGTHPVPIIATQLANNLATITNQANAPLVDNVRNCLVQ